MSRAISAFHDRALVALVSKSVLTSAEIGAAMQLADPTSVIVELVQLQLLQVARVDRTARPWCWHWSLTRDGARAALEAMARAAAERRRLKTRLEIADRQFRASLAGRS